MLTKLEEIDNLTNQFYPDDFLLRQQLFRLEVTVLRLNPRISNAILDFCPEWIRVEDKGCSWIRVEEFAADFLQQLKIRL